MSIGQKLPYRSTPLTYSRFSADRCIWSFLSSSQAFMLVYLFLPTRLCVLFNTTFKSRLCLEETGPRRRRDQVLKCCCLIKYIDIFYLLSEVTGYKLYSIVPQVPGSQVAIPGVEIAGYKKKRTRDKNVWFTTFSAKAFFRSFPVVHWAHLAHCASF